MELKVQSGNLATWQGDGIIVNLFEGVTAPGGATGAIDGCRSKFEETVIDARCFSSFFIKANFRQGRCDKHRGWYIFAVRQTPLTISIKVITYNTEIIKGSVSKL